ncbi:MAG: OsmC family protein [Flavobacterium sp.]|nr:OsmC family protein [Candidatus Neoflavobacterium equi]
MNTKKTVNVLGFTGSGNEFVVKSHDFSVNISNRFEQSENEAASPITYLLSGIAGSINAVGKLVAKDLAIEMKSIQIEISGEIESKKYSGVSTRSRAGLRHIDVVIKPTSNASLGDLKIWMDEVKERCPVYDNLMNNTPVKITLVKDYTVNVA